MAHSQQQSNMTPVAKGLERIKVIAAYPNYGVTREGLIYTRHPRPGSSKTRSWTILKQWVDSSGYYRINLCLNGRMVAMKSHRLILCGFDELPFNHNMHVNHKNFNTLDNHVDNLEWVTIAQNNNYSRVHNRPRKGGKINSDDVAVIFSMKQSGKLQREIAEHFKLSQSYVSLVLNGKKKRHDDPR